MTSTIDQVPAVPPVPTSHRSTSDKLEGSIAPSVGLVIGGLLWYVSAVCATTALLRRSVLAQEFFVLLLAQLQASGRTIIVLIGAVLVVASLVEIFCWPRSLLWRASRRRGGPLALGTVALLWLVVALLDAAVVAWGFELWVRGPYYALLGSFNWPAPDWGFVVVAVLLGPVVALLPEWLFGWSLVRLYRVWLAQPRQDQRDPDQKRLVHEVNQQRVPPEEA